MISALLQRLEKKPSFRIMIYSGETAKSKETILTNVFVSLLKKILLSSKYW